MFTSTTRRFVAGQRIATASSSVLPERDDVASSVFRGTADAATVSVSPFAAAVARLHGGVLTVESELGKGSLFTLSLPRKRTGSTTGS